MKTDLLSFVENGGCSAKIPPGLLEDVLRNLSLPSGPDVLVGIETGDDAGIYKVSNDLALVFTTDFFPPVCSDPYEFGEIAAANSLSDVYAMGGIPVTALNIMMFPSSKLPAGVYSDILKGGASKASEAGVSIIGGHTIDDAVPKYGLAVVGYVHPRKIITNAGAKPGDVLFLTKPIGTGAVLAGARLNMAGEEDLAGALRNMKQLNVHGGALMQEFGIRGATDITGFGLAGHALKMARASKVSINIDMSRVPLLGKALALTEEGCIPGASFRNLGYYEPDTHFTKGLDYNLKMLAFDAQTSGGLLVSVPEKECDAFIAAFEKKTGQPAAVIGTVTAPGEKYLSLSC